MGAIALAVLAAVAWWTVRRSLRPLVEVERTADAIARGDLSQRVPESDPRTEVGSLSASLNTMLGQIEESFRAQEISEAEARASEERMRRFVADASHELRTPLTSIRGFAELYRQGAVPVGADLDRAMGRIEGEAVRMGLLVEDLLLLARMDQQRPLRSDPVDLLPLAADTVADAGAASPDHPVALRADAGLEELLVLGDEDRLRQVLANLVSNATSHTPPGTPVELEVAAEGGEAVLEVRDDGPGHGRRVGRARLRAVLPLRPVPDPRAGARRHRARPVDRGGAGRGARRPGRAGHRARRGRDLHRAAAAGRRGR